MRSVVPGIRCSLFLVLVAFLVFSNLSNAQMSASLLGTVVDVRGNPLSGVTLKLLYQGNVTREIEVSTDDAGKFARLGLQQGPYEVTAQKDGFDVETLSFSLNVGGRALLTLTLLPHTMVHLFLYFLLKSHISLALLKSAREMCDFNKKYMVMRRLRFHHRELLLFLLFLHTPFR